MDNLRPIMKDVEQDTLDIAKVFLLLSKVQVDGKPAKDVYFTEQGIGYLNALASLDPKHFVVSEKQYLTLKEEKEVLEKEFKIISLANKTNGEAYELLKKNSNYDKVENETLNKKLRDEKDKNREFDELHSKYLHYLEENSKLRKRLKQKWWK